MLNNFRCAVLLYCQWCVVWFATIYIPEFKASYPTGSDIYWKHHGDVFCSGKNNLHKFTSRRLIYRTTVYSPDLVVTVQNLLDAAPPFYDSPLGVGYDTANANALGRVVALQLARTW